MKISQIYPGVHPQVSEKFVSDCFYLHAAQGMVNQPSEVRVRVESLENLKFYGRNILIISSFIGIRVEMQNLGEIKVTISLLIRPPIVLNTEPKVVSMDMDVGDYDIRPRIMLFALCLD